MEWGPLKPISEQGYTEDQLDKYTKEPGVEEEESGVPSQKQEILKNGIKMLLNPDPTGRRTGEACSEEYAEIIRKTLKEAEDMISKDRVVNGQVTTLKDYETVFENVKGALMIAYPMGLPEEETVRDILEDNEDLSQSAASKEIVPEAESTLWWAGKELLKNKLLSDFVGKNDKTKIIAKIQRKAQGAPVREAPLSEQAQKEMMAYYFRKQEEHKKLAENDDDDYVNSEWANPRSLKSNFNGVNNVRWNI